MTLPRLVVVACFALVLAVPFAFRPREAEVPPGAQTLVIITPHREHIRLEFARAFSAWHEKSFGAPVVVDWRTPGGTTEIRKQLQSQYTAAVQEGRIAADGATAAGSMPYDLCFGGGSYEHDQLKAGVPAPKAPGGARRAAIPISVPLGFATARLDAWYGENRVGAQVLYDPQQYWLGTALSGFGIAYNRDILARIGLDPPTKWSDLTDHKYSGWIALADPRQSGSVATTYDAILSHYGWDDGWRILRGMAANARSFSASSAKIVIDVADGDAAASTAIDFYGRYESQAMRRPGESADSSRVGYIDPPGAVAVDPDPISLLRGAPHPELAKRFIEFVLSEQGQALWQFPVKSAGDAPDALGPTEFEIRRLPVRRVMYAEHFDRFVDRVNPFEIASPTPSKGWRSLIGPMFGAFAIDVFDDMREAWNAIGAAKDRRADPALIWRMEDTFYAMPTHTLPSGEKLDFTEESFGAIKNDWRDPKRASELKIAYTEFFRGKYRDVIKMWEDRGP